VKVELALCTLIVIIIIINSIYLHTVSHYYCYCNYYWYQLHDRINSGLYRQTMRRFSRVLDELNTNYQFLLTLDRTLVDQVSSYRGFYFHWRLNNVLYSFTQNNDKSSKNIL